MAKNFTENDFYSMGFMFSDAGVSTVAICQQFCMCTKTFQVIRKNLGMKRSKRFHLGLRKIRAASRSNRNKVIDAVQAQRKYRKSLSAAGEKQIRQKVLSKSADDAETIRNCVWPF